MDSKMSVEQFDIGVVIQARMGSSRLPGKVLKEINGESLLSLLVNNIRSCQLHVQVIIATSKELADDQIVRYCEDKAIKCIRGSEDDVFSRYQLAARKYNLKHIVRLTADNPLIDKQILKYSIEEHVKYLPDFSSTRKMLKDKVVERYAPKGHSVDIINSEALLSLDSNTLKPYEREHVIPVFYNGNYKINYIKPKINDLAELTVDTAEDFERLKKHMSKWHKKA